MNHDVRLEQPEDRPRAAVRRPASVTMLLTLHLLLLLAVGWLCGWSSSIGRGVAAGEATLAGVALAMGRPWENWRPAALAIGLAGLCGAVGSLVLPRVVSAPYFVNGWEIFLQSIRTLVVGLFYWFTFRRRGIILSSTGSPFDKPLLRVPLKLFFAATLLVAMFFAVERNLDGPLYELLLVIWIGLLGLAYAAMSLLASLAPLESKPTAGQIAAYTLAILTIAAALAAQRYEQTVGWRSGWQLYRGPLFECLSEAGWVTATLVAFRLAGYRLATLVGDGS